MKIRITGNKIRVRLKEPEVQRLHEGMAITEVLEFGAVSDQQLRFRLEMYNEPELGLSYSAGCLLVYIPQSFSRALASTDHIGYDRNIPMAAGASVYLLIEKDFECLDAPEQDNEGSYPNPKQIC